MRISPGYSYPLGATWDGRSVNIALFSENATQVELCLFGSLDDERWNEDHVKRLGVRLSGEAIGEVDTNGVPILGETLLYLLNASASETLFTLPAFAVQPRWETVLDTFDGRRIGEIRDGGMAYPLVAHSLALLRLHGGGDRPA